MANNDSFIGGIDLGGTKILSVYLDNDMRELGRDYRETVAEQGPDAVIDRMVDSMLTAAKGRPFQVVGISSPGPSDPKRGIVTTPPNLPGWRDVELAKAISARLAVPAWLENDANAAAVAEHRLGAGRGASNVVLVTLGTGVGGGLILDGRLYHGASGGAGEIGHMQLEPDGPVCGCGRHGCLEALVSGRALGERAQEIIAREPDGILAGMVRDRGGEADARVLEDAALAGDASAAAAIDRAARYLGAGLTNVVNIFNPEVIVIGGSLRKIDDERYLGVAIEIMKREAFPQHAAGVRVVEAELGDESPALGAALIARENLAA
jgi:glucokinase